MATQKGQAEEELEQTSGLLVPVPKQRCGQVGSDRRGSQVVSVPGSYIP